MPLLPNEVADLSSLYDHWEKLDSSERATFETLIRRERSAEFSAHFEAVIQAHAAADDNAKQTDGSRSASAPTIGLSVGISDAMRNEALALDEDELVIEKTASQLSAGVRVGPYELQHELGRGGMGVVWLAKRADGQHERQIALKMPIAGELGWLIKARFARERAILASLEHPGIARLYETGVDDTGQPYIALEYVPGQPIHHYVRSHALKPDAIVRLFIKVLDAVSHAHAQLVIHRDIKPTNILVDAKGEPHLLDFGIAKLLDSDDGETADATQLTRESGRALTLDYASPEQINSAPLGTASDIYALGVVLFELLTGSRPYFPKGPTRRDLEQAILEQEPPRPSDHLLTTTGKRTQGASSSASDIAKASRQLRGDLDTIVLKALKKLPQQRYTTAQAFADDLKRYLAFEPIQAKPDSGWYSFKKFVRRNRVVVAGSSALVTSLSLGLVGTLYQTRIADEKARQTQHALGRHEGIRQLYVELLSTVTSWDAAAFAQPKSIANLLTKKLDELRLQYDNEERIAQWAGILNAATVQFSYMGETEAAFENSVSYLDALKRSKAAPRDVAQAQVSVARGAYSSGRYEYAESVLREALTWAPETSDPEMAAVRVFVLATLGKVLPRVGKRSEARSLLENGVRYAEANGVEKRMVALLLQEQSRVDFGFDNLSALAKIEQAQSAYLGEKTTEGMELATNRFYFGATSLEAGQLKVAETQLRNSYETLSELYGKVDHETVAVIGLLGHTLGRQERYIDAAALLDESSKALQGKTDSKSLALIATVVGRKMEIAVLEGDVRAAETAWRSLSTPDAAHPVVLYDFVLPLARIEMLLVSEQPEQVRQAVKSAQSRASAQTGVNDILLAQSMVSAMLVEGKPLDAFERATSLLNEIESRGITNSWRVAVAYELAGLAATLAGKSDQAAQLLTALDSRKELVELIPSGVEKADSELRRSRIFLALGQREKSAELARSAQSRLTKQHPKSPRLRLAKELIVASRS
jgi:serine/threonine protein kinase